MTTHPHGQHRHPVAFLGSLEHLLDEYLVTKAPFQLPVSAKEFLVKAAPYLVILFLILSLPAIFMLFGMGFFMGDMMLSGDVWMGDSEGMMWPQGAVMGMQTWVYVYGILAAIIFVMEAIAVPGLFAQSKKGWNWIYYAQVLSLVISVLAGDIIGALIGFVIGMYLLFQVKSYYK